MELKRYVGQYIKIITRSQDWFICELLELDDNDSQPDDQSMINIVVQSNRNSNYPKGRMSLKHEDVDRIEELEPEVLQGIRLTLNNVPDIVEAYKSFSSVELPNRVSFGKIGEWDQTRFPIGRFEPIPAPSSEERQSFIIQIPDITITLRHTVTNLTLDQLQTPYRPEGWTIQQVVHHMADNDMNAYLRFKRALTEDEPLAHSYREDLWAELNDYKDVPIETSILLLESLHSRFLSVLNGMNRDEYQRKLKTQLLGSITLDIALQRFVWHNRHHIAQITSLIKRNGWL